MGHGWLPVGAGAAQGNEMDALMGCTESERQSDLGSWNAPGHFVLKLEAAPHWNQWANRTGLPGHRSAGDQPSDPPSALDALPSTGS